MTQETKTHYDDEAVVAKIFRISSAVASLNRSGVSRRRRSLRLATLDGAFTAIMAGTAETFALLYGLQRGLNLSELAIVSTLPVLAGAFSQWLSPLFVSRSRLKAAILTAYCLQTLGLCGLLLLPYTENVFPLLLASLSAYWMGGMTSAPLWLDWISGWLPHSRFTHFLSSRGALIALVTLVAYLASAWAIHLKGQIQTFIYVFGVAVAARFLSIVVVSFQETPSHILRAKVVAPENSPEAVRVPVYWVLFFTTLFKFAVSFSSPFFMPYMLEDLDMGLMNYVLLTSLPFIGRFLYMARWGQAARRFRPFIALQVTMFFISFSPIMWTFGSSIGYLSLVEIWGGIVWGGFELCSVLIIQNFWPGSARRLLGMHLASMSGAALLGAYLGSMALKNGFTYHQIFLASGGMRLLVALASLVILSQIPQTRYAFRVYGDFLFTVLSLRPSFANIGRVIPLRRRHQKTKPEQNLPRRQHG